MIRKPLDPYHASHVPAHSEGGENQPKHVAGFVPTHQAEFAKQGFPLSVLSKELKCAALRDAGCNHILFNSSLINDSFQSFVSPDLFD